MLHETADEPLLEQRTRAATARDVRRVAAAASGDPDQVGAWGPVVDWPVVAIHAAVLPNGKVLAYDSVGDRAAESYPDHDFTRATVWDPATEAHTAVNVKDLNIFCSGLAHLVDGSLFFAGGNKNQWLGGLVQTHRFDPVSYAWSLGPDMAYERWYPTLTALRDGEMLITGGRPDLHEVRTASGTLRPLSSARLYLPLYPWMDVAPDGRVFYSGPDPTLRSLDPSGTGAWQTYGLRDLMDRSYGGHALYDVGKILVAGGGTSSKNVRRIDIMGPEPQVSGTAPMSYGRRQHNLTVLADGTVLATGGNSSGAEHVDLSAGVYAAELWSPGSGRWTTLAPMRTTRQYHSTALLLPDGRVLSAGGGTCAWCDFVGYLAKNAEVFWPPYLFRKNGSGELARRPEIASAPSVVRFGARFEIATADAAAIRKVALVRLGAVTHSVNMEQRYVPLSFSAGSRTLTVAAPANGHIAPPGPYMLFVIDSSGVPSVAKILTVTAGGGS